MEPGLHPCDPVLAFIIPFFYGLEQAPAFRRLGRQVFPFPHIAGNVLLQFPFTADDFPLLFRQVFHPFFRSVHIFFQAVPAVHTLFLSRFHGTDLVAQLHHLPHIFKVAVGQLLYLCFIVLLGLLPFRLLLFQIAYQPGRLVLFLFQHVELFGERFHLGCPLVDLGL